MQPRLTINYPVMSPVEEMVEYVEFYQGKLPFYKIADFLEKLEPSFHFVKVEYVGVRRIGDTSIWEMELVSGGEDASGTRCAEGIPTKFLYDVAEHAELRGEPSLGLSQRLHAL